MEETRPDSPRKLLLWGAAIIDSLWQFNFFLSGEVQENLSLFVNR
jgi:hypothetical protein